MKLAEYKFESWRFELGENEIIVHTVQPRLMVRILEKEKKRLVACCYLKSVETVGFYVFPTVL